MKDRIALFRGINVGGKNRLPMKALTATLEGLGLENIRTVIQSGNVVFDGGEEEPSALALRISKEIALKEGFEPMVMVLEAADLTAAIRENPFPEAVAEPTTLHLSFLSVTPPAPDLARLEALRADTERFHLVDRRFYLHAPDGIGRSKLAAGAEKALGVPMTARNWRTVMKLAELSRTVDLDVG